MLTILQINSCVGFYFCVKKRCNKTDAFNCSCIGTLFANESDVILKTAIEKVFCSMFFFDRKINNCELVFNRFVAINNPTLS